MQFTKLFSSILDSTIWQELAHTKIVWITLLAMADKNGEIHTSIPGLAKRAGVTLHECEQALDCLLSPDPYSRTKDHEGRRIAEIDGGFEILNHGKYRALLSAEERREYNRRKQAEYRAKKKASQELSNGVNDMSMTVNHSEQNAHSTEAEAEAEAKRNPTYVADKSTPTKPDQNKIILAKLWELTPERGRRRSSKKEVASAWSRIRANERPDLETAIRAIEAWKSCEDWKKNDGNFVPALHRWIQNRKWEDLPQATTKHQPKTIQGPEGWEDAYRELFPHAPAAVIWSLVDRQTQNQIQKSLTESKS